MENKIDVPLYVIEGLKEVRDGGKYNMYDSQGVLYELFNLNHHKAVTWLIDSKKINNTFGSQVDQKKYMEALVELGEILSLAHKLSNSP